MRDGAEFSYGINIGKVSPFQFSTRPGKAAGAVRSK